ncbi:MAG TPA: hypothetical protein VHD33_03275 [Legionellaceae bacterium]|nr:hypothetical protein [Legionellaceae bacterium]
MLIKRVITKAVLTSILGFFCHAVVAKPAFITCPTIEMLKNFDGDLVITAPLSFDVQSKTMQFRVLQKRKFDSYSPQEFAMYHDMNLVFMMSPIPATNAQNPEQVAANLLNNMQADFDVPYQYHVDDMNIESFDICSYSLPGSETKALVFVLPDDPNFDVTMFAK